MLCQKVTLLVKNVISFIKSPYLNMWRLFVIYHSYLGFFLQIAEINYIYVAVMLYSPI